MTANNFGLDADAYYNQWSVFQEKSRKLLTAANSDVEVRVYLSETKTTFSFVQKTVQIIVYFLEIQITANVSQKMFFLIKINYFINADPI